MIKSAGMARATLLVTALVLAGCKTLDAGQGLGSMVGGAAGAMIGKKVADEDNETVGVLVGATAGSLIGGAIQEYLSERDKELVANSTVETASTGSTQAWENDESGNSGTTRVVESSVVDGAECRTVEQTVILEDGAERVDTVTACKGENGWEVVS